MVVIIPRRQHCPGRAGAGLGDQDYMGCPKPNSSGVDVPPVYGSPREAVRIVY
jgi:hypothetical protein